MEKYLLTIEFRYTIMPKDEDSSSDSKTKTITIGVYDDKDTAIKQGNNTLEVLESRYKIHTYPDGREAVKERFGKNNGCFGYAKNLVTNMAYLKTPFQFFAKITTLKHEPLLQTIDNIVTELK